MRRRRGEGVSSERGHDDVEPFSGSRRQKWSLIADMLLDIIKHDKQRDFVLVSGRERAEGEVGAGPSTRSSIRQKRARPAGRGACEQGDPGPAEAAGARRGKDEAASEKQICSRRRTTLKFYLTWAKRAMILKAVIMLLCS